LNNLGFPAGEAGAAKPTKRGRFIFVPDGGVGNLSKLSARFAIWPCLHNLVLASMRRIRLSLKRLYTVSTFVPISRFVQPLGISGSVCAKSAYQRRVVESSKVHKNVFIKWLAPLFKSQDYSCEQIVIISSAYFSYDVKLPVCSLPLRSR
jgi:hypothetical protein